MKDIYLAIKDRLIQATGIDVNWYAEQYQQIGEQQLWNTPILFIELMPLNYAQRGLNAQESVLEFAIHLVTESVGEDAETRLFDTQHFEHVDLIFAALQGYSAQDTQERTILNTVVRTQLETMHDASNLIVTVQKFTSTIFDYSAVSGTSANAILKLDVKY